VVPQAAIVQGARGKLVYVVEPGNKAGVRPVEVVHAAGTEAVVTGVQPGDRVVVDGRQNLRPGSNVIDRPIEAASGAGRSRRAASAPAAAGSGAALAAEAAASPASGGGTS
jgi:hypothetical protein